MNSALPFLRGFHFVRELSVVSAFSFLGCSLFAEQLLIEKHQGGPTQYFGSQSPARAYFDLVAPTRIQSLQFWTEGLGPVTVGIYQDEQHQTTFELKEPPMAPKGELEQPALWQGVSGLEWDMDAGTYQIFISGGVLPYALGYLGPLSPVPEPSYYHFYYNGEWQADNFGFGVRIYGTPLSAVPEPTTYGLMGSFTLLLGVAFRRRWFIAKPRPSA